MSFQQYRPSAFSLLPEVVKNLLIINGIFFLATYIMQNQGINLIDLLGLHYFEAEKFKPYQFLTYMFMHGGFTHILFNMLAVWMFGSAIENVWGGKKLLTYYIITGLGAALVHYAVVYFEMRPALAVINDYIENPDLMKLQDFVHSEAFTSFSSAELVDSYNNFVRDYSSVIGIDPQSALQLSVDFMKVFRSELLNAPVVVGASGAVFGLLLAYGMLFPNSIIYIYFALPIRAKYFVILYGAIELFSGILNVPGDNVAHFAHLGGLIFGFILIQYWKRNNRNNYYQEF
jgi:membrane associated rhomboid family serine protease